MSAIKKLLSFFLLLIGASCLQEAGLSLALIFVYQGPVDVEWFFSFALASALMTWAGAALWKGWRLAYGVILVFLALHMITGATTYRLSQLSSQAVPVIGILLLILGVFLIVSSYWGFFKGKS